MGVNAQFKLGLISMISPKMSSVWGEEMRGRVWWALIFTCFIASG